MINITELMANCKDENRYNFRTKLHNDITMKVNDLLPYKNVAIISLMNYISKYFIWKNGGIKNEM